MLPIFADVKRNEFENGTNFKTVFFLMDLSMQQLIRSFSWDAFVRSMTNNVASGFIKIVENPDWSACDP